MSASVDQSSFPGLEEDEFRAVTRMAEAWGPGPARDLIAMDPEQQRSRIAEFSRFERENANRAAAAIPPQVDVGQVIAQVMAQMPQQSDIGQIVAQAVASAMTHVMANQHPSVPASLPAPSSREERDSTPRSKPVKFPVAKYAGKEDETLVVWIRQVDMTLRAGLLTEPKVAVAFAISHLDGAAHKWAMTREVMAPGFFSSWEVLQQELKEKYLPENMPFRKKAQFFALRQFRKESLADYVTRVQTLVAEMADSPLDESVQVVVFMEGLQFGPVKTKLYRDIPATLEGAVRKASREAYSHRQAKGGGAPLASATPSSDGAEPMDLSSVEQPFVERCRCYHCNAVGHLRRNCPQRHLARKGSVPTTSRRQLNSTEDGEPPAENPPPQ